MSVPSLAVVKHHPEIYISFSGGKDSVAAWLYITRDLALPATAVFCNTGHEAPETYDYIWQLARDHGLNLMCIQPRVRDLWLDAPPKDCQRTDLDDPMDMERLAIEKHRFPSPTARFCTTHLKLLPYRRWLREFSHHRALLISGVRAEESPKRAALAPWHWDELMERQRWLPIHNWPVAQVFDIHQRYGVPVNPLYKRGCGRVGCYPCIMAKKGELAAIAQYDPATFDNLESMESRVASTLRKRVMTFFSRSKTPKAYRSSLDENSRLHVPTAEDVRRWALGHKPRHVDGELYFGSAEYEDDGEDVFAPACSSPYGLCE